MLCLPRAFELLTTFSDDTLDVERFAQVRSYRCSCRRANARVGGQNLLTSSGIYQWQIEDLLEKVERKPEGKQTPRALDAQRVESVLRQIVNPRDRALFWLIYDGGLRCQEALAIDIEDISWPDRSILIQGKGDRPREMFFSRAVGTLLDKYLTARGGPTAGPLFVTHRKARLPRRADLTPDGYARLSYRQADTLWKQYTPDWDLHQLRHTAISVRAAHDYTEVDLKRFSGHTSLRSLERYIADNREAAKRKAH